jgi:CheY-like chemotaxis protein
MPGMDGFAVYERLKAEESTRDIPAIFIGSLNETTDQMNALSRIGVDFVTKSFQAEEDLQRTRFSTAASLHARP